MDMNNTPEPRMPLVENLEFLDLMGVISSPCIICGGRIRRSAGEHRTRLTSANQWRRRRWPPDAMPSRCCEFVDSRLRRSPPDRASAVPYGQAGENAMRFPHLAHRSAAAHKLHSTRQQNRMNLISRKGETSSRLPGPFSLFLPGSCPNNRCRCTTAPLISTFSVTSRGELAARACRRWYRRWC
jgi:hypothetical protein